MGFSVKENPDKTRLTSSSFSLPYVDDLFSASPQERLCISFSRSSSLDIRLFTYAFSCSLSRSTHRTLPILASFLTFLRGFLDLLYAIYLLLFSTRCVRCELRYKYFGIFDNVVFIVIPVQNLSFSSLQEYRFVISYVLCANAVKMRETMKIIMILNIISLTVCI